MEVMYEGSMKEGGKESVTSQAKNSVEVVEEKPRSIPPPGNGQRIYDIDPLLRGHHAHLDYR